MPLLDMLKEKYQGDSRDYTLDLMAHRVKLCDITISTIEFDPYVPSLSHAFSILNWCLLRHMNAKSSVTRGLPHQQLHRTLTTRRLRMRNKIKQFLFAKKFHRQ